MAEERPAAPIYVDKGTLNERKVVTFIPSVIITDLKTKCSEGWEDQERMGVRDFPLVGKELRFETHPSIFLSRGSNFPCDLHARNAHTTGSFYRELCDG